MGWPLLAIVLALAACSGDDGSVSSDGTEPSTTAVGETTTTTTTVVQENDSEPTDPGDGTVAATPSELNGRLASAGIDCAGYADADPQAAIPGPDAEGRCEIGEEVVYLYSFDDVVDQEAFVEEGGLFDCSFVSAFAGGATIPFAAGDGWVVRPQTQEEANAIADALGGEADAVVCEPVAAG